MRQESACETSKVTVRQLNGLLTGPVLNSRDSNFIGSNYDGMAAGK